VPLVDGRSIRSVGNTNYARLNDPAVNGLIDQARAAGSADAWREVADSAAAASVYVPLAETRIQLLAGQRLRNGVVMQPYSGHDVATAGVR
jgi:peptide/nickel transport system substrate-binding protein